MSSLLLLLLLTGLVIGLLVLLMRCSRLMRRRAGGGRFDRRAWWAVPVACSGRCIDATVQVLRGVSLTPTTTGAGATSARLGIVAVPGGARWGLGCSYSALSGPAVVPARVLGAQRMVRVAASPSAAAAAAVPSRTSHPRGIDWRRVWRDGRRRKLILMLSLLLLLLLLLVFFLLML